MKKATVKFTKVDNKIAEGYLVETIDDVLTVKKFAEQRAEGLMRKFSLSGESSNRLDHMLHGVHPLEKAFGRLAIAYGLTQETNALFCIPNAMQQYISTLSHFVVKGETAFINKDFGIVGVKDYLEIVEAEPVDNIEYATRFVCPDGTKVIVLENDWEIPNESFRMFAKIDGKASMILELGLVPDIRLKQMLETFKNKGGDTVFVYTTGMGLEQMYNYSKIAISVGLTNFIFKFSISQSDGVKGFISHLSKWAKVKVL